MSERFVLEFLAAVKHRCTTNHYVAQSQLLADGTACADSDPESQPVRQIVGSPVWPLLLSERIFPAIRAARLQQQIDIL